MEEQRLTEDVDTANNPEGGRTVLSFDVGIRHLAYCRLKTDGFVVRIEAWDSIDLGSNVKRDIDRLTCALLTELKDRFTMSLVRNPEKRVEVVIENQPAMKNPVMKTIQTVLYTFFQMMRLGSSSDDRHDIKSVRLVSAGSKTRLKSGSFLSSAPALPAANNYAARKKWSVEMTRFLLQTQQQEIPLRVSDDPVGSISVAARTFIDGGGSGKRGAPKSPKLDDLADALLQGLVELQRA